jgi:NitT/TauT family transport system substrate-binding protein
LFGIKNIKSKKMKTFKVTEECISCHACVEVAPNNFAMNSLEIAYVKKQPENSDEEKRSQEALDVCPVQAIEITAQNQNLDKEPILASSNIKKTLDSNTLLKDVLINFSPKFSKLLNPIMYNTLAKFATFNEAAKVTGISICEILHILNQANGTIDKLQKLAPDCLKQLDANNLIVESDEITWTESMERYIYNADSMPELIEKITHLSEQENLVYLSVSKPTELINLVRGLNLKINISQNREYRLSIFNPKKPQSQIPWQERKEDFELLDVRSMQTDPFDIIIKKAYSLKEDEGFVLIQRFEPFPIMNMLSEMGFEHTTEYFSQTEIWVYFYKKPSIVNNEETSTNKTDVVIQSATPVAYPVIMRLLQSEVIRKSVNIKELKVWEETEKHLAWITTGKADISFSAVITAAKLKNADIKIPALFVWDNFVLLTRYKAKDFSDIKGKNIYTPLFEEAPPAKITKYLIKASGLDVADFNFVYGEPFGRPEEIYADFVSGNADTVILREPEASYAIKVMQDRGQEISVISFNEIWNKYNPNFGSFPNAGIVFKGEFVRQNPELAEVFLDELKKAIEWVNENKKEAAKLSFDMMRQSVDRVELFLNRVNFNYVQGDELVQKVKDYFSVLTKQGIVDTKIDDDFYDLFKL